VKVAPDSGESGLLLVSAIQANTISMYFMHLNNINFDESIDVLPTNSKSEKQDVGFQDEDYQQAISKNDKI
jgi:hypothetical protein